MTVNIGSAGHYPPMAAAEGRVETAPRRVRSMVGDQLVFDTSDAAYVWEAPYYPQYYVPLGDVVPGLLVDSGRTEETTVGMARVHDLRIDQEQRDGAAQVFDDGRIGRPGEWVRFEWSALDSWFEEDEEIFVHPRNPYVRVDALRSQRSVQVSLDGVVLAESRSPVLLFETGLPTRYYLPPTDVRFGHLVPSETVTQCPYKGTTTQWWSVRTPTGLHEDLAWTYRFTTDAIRAVSGLVAFYDEKVDVVLDGEPLPRPHTKFS